MALALAGDATSTLELGVAVVPTWPRHPIVMAQQAATASAATGGRFRLGVGPSHAPVMGMYGIDFDRPISHVREYLTIVRALLADGQVAFEGERFHVTGFLDVADAPAPAVLLSVLRAQMARLAGGYADGALCWLTPAAYLHDVVAPNLRAGAEAEAVVPTPPLVAELPCALSTDRQAVHAMAARDLAIYPQVPFYRAMFEAAGVPRGERGWSDEMIDASVLSGDEDGLAAGHPGVARRGRRRGRALAVRHRRRSGAVTAGMHPGVARHREGLIHGRRRPPSREPRTGGGGDRDHLRGGLRPRR